MSKRNRIQIGDRFKTNQSGYCFVTDYIEFNKVKVKFENSGIEVFCGAGNLRKGEVRDPSARLLVGVGFIGVGKYNSTKNRDAYSKWHHMISRCYSGSDDYKTYKGCTVCYEWHNFQNFADWFYKNLIPFDGMVHLDKDILSYGNKVYSPENCCIVPHQVNESLTRSDSSRGKYPLGVTWHAQAKGFAAKVNDGNGRTLNIGIFNDEISAFFAYKKAKEALIKKRAEEFKEFISHRAYDALINYKVVDDSDYKAHLFAKEVKSEKV